MRRVVYIIYKTSTIELRLKKITNNNSPYETWSKKVLDSGFRLSVAVRFRIPAIKGIPDSSSRIVLPIPVFELPYIGGNDSHNKQTGKKI